MRLYAVADIHGKTGRLERIRDMVRRHCPDVVLVAGDICHYVRPWNVFRSLNALGVPILTVSGNSDRSWHAGCLHRYPRIFSLDQRKITLNGFHFAGIAGTLPLPFRSRLRLREKTILENAFRLIDPHTILVVHPPPFGTLDRVLGRFHAGSRAVTRIIAHCKPRMVFCGHIHEDPGTAMMGPTLVVNCSIGASGNGVIVDLDCQHGPHFPPSSHGFVRIKNPSK